MQDNKEIEIYLQCEFWKHYHSRIMEPASFKRLFTVGSPTTLTCC